MDVFQYFEHLQKSVFPDPGADSGHAITSEPTQMIRKRKVLQTRFILCGLHAGDPSRLNQRQDDPHNSLKEGKIAKPVLLKHLGPQALQESPKIVCWTPRLYQIA